ncbi:hypothetical protein [Rhodobacteraceae bacterium DSL-40]|uniref:hypothetical protein n=1 Tax=Amaricoccus sp. B4 TaxID=3368557 RepID=UPI000DAC45FA
MTDQSRSFQTVMIERTQLVCQLVELNGTQVRLVQDVGGAEIDVMTCERTIAEDGESAAARSELEAAIQRQEAALAALAECETRLLHLEGRVDALDREIAAAMK